MFLEGVVCPDRRSIRTDSARFDRGSTKSPYTPYQSSIVCSSKEELEQDKEMAG